MVMEEKLVINELEQGKEFTIQLMNNLKNPSSSSSSIESNKFLISAILRCYDNAMLMLSIQEDKKSLKSRSVIEDRGFKNGYKKRKVSEKKTEKIRVLSAQEGASIDDGYSWRKYGQKEIHGSKNPRGYFRCTHRFTQSCLAVKQVQRSDTDPSIYEVKYLGSHTCNNTTTTTSPKFSLTISNEQHKVKEQSEEDIKPMKSLEDLDIFNTFSFSNTEIENIELKNNIFLENLSPTTSGSGITNEFFAGTNSETADSCFSSLGNIIDIEDIWSQLL